MLRTIYHERIDPPHEERRRFWDKVRPAGECMVWTAYCNPGGYGKFKSGKHPHRETHFAHRYAYLVYRGSIPAGFTIDHLCRTRACVRPDHLECVSHAENVRRGLAGEEHRSKTHCRNGHPFDAENTYIWGTERRCRTCGRDAALRYVRRIRRQVYRDRSKR